MDDKPFYTIKNGRFLIKCLFTVVQIQLIILFFMKIYSIHYPDGKFAVSNSIYSIILGGCKTIIEGYRYISNAYKLRKA